MEIADWRKKIDGLDVQIVALISERAAAAKAIGELKLGQQIPIYEPKREQDVYENVRRANQGPLSEGDMILIYERLMDVMRGLQRVEPK